MRYSREFLASWSRRAQDQLERKQDQVPSVESHNKLFLVISYIITLCMAYMVPLAVIRYINADRTQGSVRTSISLQQL